MKLALAAVALFAFSIAHADECHDLRAEAARYATEFLEAARVSGSITPEQAAVAMARMDEYAKRIREKCGSTTRPNQESLAADRVVYEREVHALRVAR